MKFILFYFISKVEFIFIKFISFQFLNNPCFLLVTTMSLKKPSPVVFDKKEKVLNKLKKIFEVNDILIESYSFGWDSSTLYIGYLHLCINSKTKLFDKVKPFYSHSLLRKRK
jgi:hypothetical protein